MPDKALGDRRSDEGRVSGHPEAEDPLCIAGLRRCSLQHLLGYWPVQKWLAAEQRTREWPITWRGIEQEVDGRLGDVSPYQRTVLVAQEAGRAAEIAALSQH